MILYKNSLYIKVDTGIYKKPQLAEGVFGAMFMYLICMFVSGYMWYRISNEKFYNDDDLRLLD
jgi:hypothetical protein